MAEYFRFFDSTEGDVREYQASEFAEYFSRFLTDGVYTENGSMGLRVSTVDGFNIKVSPGYAFMRGYMYESDEDIEFTLNPSDVVLDRIDRIVLRLDIVNRRMNIRLKEGALGSIPSPPPLIDTVDVKELPIAQIRVIANSTSGIITDERVPVSSLIEIPLDEIWEVFYEWFDSVKNTLGRRVMVGTTEPADIQAGDLWFRELE